MDKLQWTIGIVEEAATAPVGAGSEGSSGASGLPGFSGFGFLSFGSSTCGGGPGGTCPAAGDTPAAQKAPRMMVKVRTARFRMSPGPVVTAARPPQTLAPRLGLRCLSIRQPVVPRPTRRAP